MKCTYRSQAGRGCGSASTRGNERDRTTEVLTSPFFERPTLVINPRQIDMGVSFFFSRRRNSRFSSRSLQQDDRAALSARLHADGLPALPTSVGERRTRVLT